MLIFYKLSMFKLLMVIYVNDVLVPSYHFISLYILHLGTINETRNMILTANKLGYRICIR